MSAKCRRHARHVLRKQEDVLLFSSSSSSSSSLARVSLKMTTGNNKATKSNLSKKISLIMDDTFTAIIITHAEEEGAAIASMFFKLDKNNSILYENHFL